MKKFNFILAILLASFAFSQFADAQDQAEKEKVKNLRPGKLIETPKPKFPATAKALGISGQVNVVVVIDKDGNVVSAEAVTGHPLLRAAAVEAARQAKFTSTTLNGEKIKVSGTISYNFIKNPNWEKVGNSLGAIARRVPSFGSDVIESEFVGNEFGELKEELSKLLQSHDTEEKAALAAKLINSIQQKLSIQEPTGAWYFKLGTARSAFELKTGEERSFVDNLPKIKELFDSAPADTPTEMLNDLAKVIEFSNKPDLTIEDRKEIIRLLTESYNRTVNLP